MGIAEESGLQAIDIWIMRQFYFPDASGGTSKTKRITNANREGMRRLEEMNLIQTWGELATEDGSFYYAQLTGAGILYMRDFYGFLPA